MALTQISTAGVKDDAVTAGKIPANAVGSSELADNAVDTAAIVNNAVTAGKLASGVTDLSNDTSPQLGGNLASNGNLIKFGDSGGASDDRLTFGNGDDIQIYYATSNLYITQATGDIILENTGTNTSNQIYIKGKANTDSIVVHGNGRVELYDQSTGSASKKFETTSAGAQIFNTLEVGNTTAPFLIESTTNGSGTEDIGRLGINRTNASTSDRQIWLQYTVNENNALAAFQARSANDTGTAGTYLKIDAVNNNVDLPRDNEKLQLGAGNDLKIYHSGTGSYIDNEVGSLYLRDTGGAEKVRINGYGTAITGGLLFGTDTAAANALDDYEEGKFTPYFKIEGRDVSDSPVDNVDATYVKVGQMVTCHYTITCNNTPTTNATGRAWEIHGFPFQSKNDLSNGYIGAGQRVDNYSTGTYGPDGYFLFRLFNHNTYGRLEWIDHNHTGTRNASMMMTDNATVMGTITYQTDA